MVVIAWKLDLQLPVRAVGAYHH